MSLFAYKALATNGSVTTGEIEAVDRPEALRLLDRKGLQPVNLKEKASAVPNAARAKGKAKSKDKETSAERPRNGSKAKSKEDEIPEGPIKLKRQEVVLFTEELSDMLSAGLQLEPALKSMENRQELGNLKAVSFKIRPIVRATLQAVGPPAFSLSVGLIWVRGNRRNLRLHTSLAIRCMSTRMTGIIFGIRTTPGPGTTQSTLHPSPGTLNGPHGCTTTPASILTVMVSTTEWSI